MLVGESAHRPSARDRLIDVQDRLPPSAPAHHVYVRYAHDSNGADPWERHRDAPRQRGSARAPVIEVGLSARRAPRGLLRCQPGLGGDEPLCLEQNVGVIPYSSLGSGFLSGKYRRGETLPSTARAAGVQKAYMTERGFAVLAAVEKVAAGLGVTPTQVAISWLAHRPGITAPIASATSKTQLQELVAGVKLQLDAEARKTLDEASAWRDA